MGLHMTSGVWGCWRDEKHRGSNPDYLISRLLRVDGDTAKALAQQYFKYIPRSDRPQRCINLRRETEYSAGIMEFKSYGEPLLDNIQNQFKQYLRARGYDPEPLISRYGLRFGFGGAYNDRLIVPVFASGLRTWAGRAIRQQEPIRYKMAPEQEMQCRPSDFLFDQDNLTGGELLLIQEGPFDAMKTWSALIPGVSATAVFGKIVTEAQVRLLEQIAPKYEVVAMRFDADATLKQRDLVNKLSWYIPNIRYLPPAAKDHGDMTLDEITAELQYFLGAQQ